MLAITGATGHLGRATIHALLHKVAPTEIIAVVRDPAKADALREQGIHVRRGDYNEPASLVAAFQGVDTLLLISSNELENRTQQQLNAVDAARQAGVRHVVYTSVLNPSPTSHFSASASHVATEEHLRASGLAYTLFRNTLYLDLVPLFVGEGALPSGKIYFAGGEGRASYALREEIGQALAHVLTSEGHANQTYDIAPGPAYSLQDIATALSTVAGQPVEYVPISAEVMAAGMRQHHVPEPVVAITTGLATAISANEFNASSPTFEQLLGRKPTDLTTYLTKVYGQ